MKKIFLLIATFGFLSAGCTESTVTEKAEAVVNDSTRAVNKVANRAEEAACGKLTGDSKAHCVAKLTINRIEEATDATIDKASELKDKL